MKSSTNVIKLEVLEERVANMIRENSEEHSKILENIQKLSDKFDNLPNLFVSHKEFEPVQKIVNGLVWLVVVAIVGAVIKLVLKV